MGNHKTVEETKTNSWKDYFKLGEVTGYFFRKKDPSRPTNFSIRAMHGVNKLSILIFLLGIIYMIIKHLF